MEVIREHTAFAADGSDPVTVGSGSLTTEILAAVPHDGGPADARPFDGGLGDVLKRILDGALDLTGADLGNVQLCDPASEGLRIAAHAGFGADFLDHFALVTDDDSACGRAARVHAQTVIADVELDQDFLPHRAIAAASGFRAVVSTPLIDHTGALVGMVSTHLRGPGRPDEHALRSLRIYGKLAGDAVARTWDPGTRASREARARAADRAVNRIFAASLTLAGTPAATGSVWRDRLDAAVDELDQAVREIRDAAIDPPRG